MTSELMNLGHGQPMLHLDYQDTMQSIEREPVYQSYCKNHPMVDLVCVEGRLQIRDAPVQTIILSRHLVLSTDGFQWETWKFF